MILDCLEISMNPSFSSFNVMFIAFIRKIKFYIKRCKERLKLNHRFPGTSSHGCWNSESNCSSPTTQLLIMVTKIWDIPADNASSLQWFSLGLWETGIMSCSSTRKTTCCGSAAQFQSWLESKEISTAPKHSV